jgi:nucleoid DNA-binding protein
MAKARAGVQQNSLRSISRNISLKLDIPQTEVETVLSQFVYEVGALLKKGKRVSVTGLATLQYKTYNKEIRPENLLHGGRNRTTAVLRLTVKPSSRLQAETYMKMGLVKEGATWDTKKKQWKNSELIPAATRTSSTRSARTRAARSAAKNS